MRWCFIFGAIFSFHSIPILSKFSMCVVSSIKWSHSPCCHFVSCITIFFLILINFVDIICFLIPLLIHQLLFMFLHFSCSSKEYLPFGIFEVRMKWHNLGTVLINFQLIFALYSHSYEHFPIVYKFSINITTLEYAIICPSFILSAGETGARWLKVHDDPASYSIIWLL